MSLFWLYGEIPDYRYRLINYVGDGFLIGAAGDAALHFTRGLGDSPTGGGGRLAAAARAVRANVPHAAGAYAARLAVFWAFESGVSLARGREDHWSSVAAAVATASLVNLHRGAPAAALLALRSAAAFAGISAAYYWAFQSWHDGLLRAVRDAGRMQGDLPGAGAHHRLP